MVEAFQPDPELANFSTDREPGHGLVLRNTTPLMVNTTGDEKQDWAWTAPRAMTIEGDGLIRVHYGSADLTSGTRNGFAVRLYHCVDDCTLVSMNNTRSPAIDGWNFAELNLGKIKLNLEAGDRLELHIGAPSAMTTTDLRLAYDAVGYDSVLIIE